MSDITQLLNALQQGDPHAAEELLPLVYQELRKLAAQRLAREQTGQTLQATALVHEAYLRLVGKGDPGWQNRGHFFAAAAEGMRRIGTSLMDGPPTEQTTHGLPAYAGGHAANCSRRAWASPRPSTTAPQRCAASVGQRPGTG